MCRVLRHVLLCLCISIVNAVGSTQSTNSENSDQVPHTTLPNVISGPPALASATGLFIFSSNWTGTCSSRTINYITHTLARQCLRTNRAAYSSSNTTYSKDDDGRADASEASASSTPSPATTKTIVVTSTVDAKTVVGDITSHASEGAPQSSTAATNPSSVVEASSVSPTDEESDSPLDTAGFLSFEEWKKQNLAKSGQSPEDVGHAQQVPVHRPRPINNALDTMGDEQEIDIDFAGFRNPAQPSQSVLSSTAAGAAHSTPGAGDSGSLRSKDAGKTCKERTNYASFDCAATILKSNKECKHASSVLVENKDSYMLNKCSADNKFFIVELCNDIQIDTIVLANYEFFSSGFRHFRVSVSDRYPVKMEKWKTLGTFEARNTREIQAFLVENPQIWARYLRIEFLTQYGTEYYCPVSLLRVHGVTMMEDYRHQEELARGEVEDATLEAEVTATPVVKQEPPESTDENLKATAQAIPSIEVEPSEQPQTSTSEPPLASTAVGTTSQAASATDAEETVIVYSNGSVSMQVGVYEPNNVNMTCNAMLESAGPATVTSQGSVVPRTATKRSSSTGNARERSPAADITASGSTNTTSSVLPEGESSESVQVAGNSAATTSISSNSTVSPSSSTTATVIPSNSTGEQPTLSNSTRSSIPSPPPPQPSTQESFFKSVTKRLSLLESNSTLSLQYISEQSLLLREAFLKVEKRQISKTTDFLSHLNQTVMQEVYSLRRNCEELWQSTVLEMELRGEAHASEMLEVGKRLNVVAEELVWQKRVGILQSTLILICLALVLFERYGNGNGGAEMPLLEQILCRSSAALRKGWESPPDSPGLGSSHSRSPVSLFRRKIWRASTEPGDVKYAAESQTRNHEVSNTADNENEDPARAPGIHHEAVEFNAAFEEERHSRASMESERPGSSVGVGPSSAQSSPGKKRKKMKKASGWLGGSSQGQQQQQQQRAKSPLALGGVG